MAKVAKARMKKIHSVAAEIRRINSAAAGRCRIHFEAAERCRVNLRLRNVAGFFPCQPKSAESDLRQLSDERIIPRQLTDQVESAAAERCRIHCVAEERRGIDSAAAARCRSHSVAAEVCRTEPAAAESGVSLQKCGGSGICSQGLDRPRKAKLNEPDLE